MFSRTFLFKVIAYTNLYKATANGLVLSKVYPDASRFLCSVAHQVHASFHLNTCKIGLNIFFRIKQHKSSSKFRGSPNRII